MEGSGKPSSIARRKTAIQRLTSLIGALPDRASPYPAHTIAARLVALLPRGLAPGASSGTSNGFGEVMKSQQWWVYVVFMSFMLGSQFLIASYQLPAKVDGVGGQGFHGPSPGGAIHEFQPVNVD